MRTKRWRLLTGILGLMSLSIALTQQIGAKEIEKSDKPKTKPSGYKHYFNEKYGYSIDYPSFLEPQGEPDAHDGQCFFSPTQPLSLTVWATYSNWQSGEEMPIEEERDWDLKHLASKDLPEAKVTQKLSEKNWFVISGTSAKNIFYRYTLKTHDAFVTALFTYPQTKKSEYEPLVEHVTQSLKE